jgi:hypothetical protein
MKTHAVALTALVSIFAGTAAQAADTPANQVIPDSQNQIIRMVNEGLRPEQLRMKLQDSIVFFLNESTDALVTLEVDYSGKKTHCATKNMQIEENDKIHSARPIPPRDFASVCFHERGTYPLTVYGLPKDPKGIHTSILVE